MIETLDAVLPIASFVTFALLTVPVIKAVRKTAHKTALTFAWFLAAFVVGFFTVANLALKYYALPPEQGFVNLPLTVPPGSSLAPISSAFMIDGVSVYMAVIFTAVSAVVFMYSVFWVDPSKRPSERYYAIMLILVGALIGAVFSGDLLTMFIFWEAAAAGSSFLMLYRKTPRSLNATLKYLVMIIVASAFVVFGLSLLYGLTGSLNFWVVKSALATLTDKTVLVLAFIFIAAGYAIESAIVPFHFWLPDAYAAAPASSSAFLSALIDQGSYYVLIRVLLFIITPTGALDWTIMLAVMAAFTMVVGNLFALIQDDVKRLIGNICVADVGYNLVGITSVTSLGITGNLYFFLIGGITTALSFMAVGIINHYGFRSLEDFSGIGRKMPLAALALSLAAFSFAGIPPFGGFTAKFLVFTSAIEGGMTWLAVIGVLMSVVQTAYLFRLINYMYARKPKDDVRIKEPKRLLVPVFILAGTILVLGLYPQIVFNLIDPVIKQFPLIL